MWRDQILVKRSSIWAGEFGISIFERSSKGVKATREGQKFLEYAKRIIYEIEEMKRDCSDLGERKSLI